MFMKHIKQQVAFNLKFDGILFIETLFHFFKLTGKVKLNSVDWSGKTRHRAPTRFLQALRQPSGKQLGY